MLADPELPELSIEFRALRLVVGLLTSAGEAEEEEQVGQLVGLLPRARPFGHTWALWRVGGVLDVFAMLQRPWIAHYVESSRTLGSGPRDMGMAHYLSARHHTTGDPAFLADAIAVAKEAGATPEVLERFVARPSEDASRAARPTAKRR